MKEEKNQMTDKPQDARKKWTPPELLVLVRNQPEEMVLGSCKNELITGPSGSAGGCNITGDESGTCQTNVST